MIADIGLAGLLCAAGAALVGCSVMVRPQAWRGRVLVRWSTVHLAIVLLPTTALIHALANDDFSISFVHANSSTSLPIWYKITALWGGHEGSMLLWLCIAAMIILRLAISTGGLPAARRAVGLLALLSVGYSLYALSASSPFDLLLPYPPIEGRDLNPLLQDITFLIHPPLLYAGYLTAIVPAALLIGTGFEQSALDRRMHLLLRRWTLISWTFLTAGIGLGSWWAYRELGWGGFWFWDPVETASFIPWLTLTALVHLLRLHPARTDLALVYATAAASATAALMGAFLVRSGALVSVHAFTSDPTRGLALLAVILVFNFAAVLGWRKLSAASASTSPAHISTRTDRRKLFFELQSYAMLLTAALVTIGLLYPIAHELATDIPLTVGAGFYGTFFPPLVFMVALCAGPVLILAGGSMTMQTQNSTRLAITTGIAALALMFASALVYDRALWSIAPLSVLFGVWVCGWSAAMLHKRWNQKVRSRNLLASGIAHFGFGLAIIGAGLASAASTETESRMYLHGSPAQFMRGEVRLVDHKREMTPHFHQDLLVLDFADSDKTMTAPRRFYPLRGIETAEAAVDSSLAGDVYVAVGQSFADASWGIRLQYRPLIWAFWLGIALACLAGIFALSRPPGAKASEGRTRNEER